MTKWMREFFEKWAALGGLQRCGHGVPGEAIFNASPEEREQLKNLKSEDLMKIRPDTINFRIPIAQSPECYEQAYKNHLVEIKRKMIPRMASPDFCPDDLEERDQVYLRRIIEDEMR